MKPFNPPAQNYLSLHSPRGACAHFALGLYGSGGGFGLQADRAAANDVYIGIKRGAQITCLPFYKNAQSAELTTFLGETAKGSDLQVHAFAESVIRREHRWGSDTWHVPGLSFSLFTPVSGIPDPKTASESSFKNAITPAIPARLVIDNRNGVEPIQGFFGVSGVRGLRQLADETNGVLTGWAAVQGYGFACDRAANPRVRAAAHWDLVQLFTPPHPTPFCLGGMAVLLVDVPAGEQVTLNFSLGWYQPGTVTRGLLDTGYAYTRYFRSLTDVLTCGVRHAAQWITEAETADAELLQSGLNADQQFMIAQATSAYWASSMLFEDPASVDGARWVVNEGSFMMLNTFDLAVDHLFFELRQQPWVVKNVLECYVQDYSYRDQLHFPGESIFHPGGVSFTHDQGSFFTFSPAGYSSYEISDQPGCYSYMTQEQLVNWLVCAGLYAAQEDDQPWLEANRDLINDCLHSMLLRDHPDPAKRDGIMDLDSSRTGSAEEITTYDSLDASLGQARRNLYLAVKGWAAYLVLESLFTRLGEPAKAAEALAAAHRAADTICAAFDPELGYIPAILDGIDRSPIIPAVEGLIFPYRMGRRELVSPDGPFGELVGKLKQHLQTVLQPGMCLFEDGAWRLSAHSTNSWISKVFLCQSIARDILKMDFGQGQLLQDRAHADWWREGSKPNPAIDQIFAGKTSEVGFYYPRAVTCILWIK